MSEVSSGWIGYGPGGPGADLPPEVRSEVLRRRAQRQERRGALLAVVEVRVWENGEADPQVSMPPGCTLSVEDPPERIADVVRIARDALTDWR